MSAATMRRAAVLAAALALTSAAAQAGRSCENQPPRVDAIQRSMLLAEHTARQLDASGAQVVVLARMGQNLSEYGVRYSHFGLAYRDGGKLREGGQGPAVWRVVHKLNQCGTSKAAVYRQGLGEFFLDDLYQYEAAVVVPTPEVQARLLPMLKDNARLAQLNTPAYSMVAYPWALTYQQSNQWALETFAMTQDPAAQTRERAQAWLRLQGYEPTTLRISAMKRPGGSLDRGQRRVRRPPQREALHGQDRDRHRRFGVHVVESLRPGRAGAGHPVNCGPDPITTYTTHTTQGTA